MREKYGEKPHYVHWEGAVNRETPLIREETLQELVNLLPKGLAIVTGKGRWEAEKTLGPLLRYFDLEASVFIADQREAGEKPDPTTLIECAEKLKAEKIIYVGDSAEDLLLVKNAVKEGLDASFAGVLTNEYALNFFIENEADIILEDVNNLPKIFRREETIWSPF